MFTMKDSQAWSSLPECYYYGSFTGDGLRSGPGVLYSKKAGDDEKFMECLMSEETKQTKFVPSDDKDKYKLYEGNFDKGMPHDVSGNAKQWMFSKDKEGQWKFSGMYEGHFKAGRRHGQGKFTSSERDKWTYDFIRDKAAHNWANDEMHGIAVVTSQNPERKYENIIFTKNVNQMGDRQHSQTEQLETIIKGAMNLKDLLQFGIGSGAGLRRSNEEVRNPDFIQGEVKINSEQLLLLRQPTDIHESHEDVYVTVKSTGPGTANAEELGGLYVKLSQSFGMNIYKNQQVVTKNVTSAFGSAMGFKIGGGTVDKMMTRYLFQDKQKLCWIISEKVENDSLEKLMELGATSAIVDDSSKSPSDIRKPWYVFHEDTKMFWLPNDPSFQEKKEEFENGTFNNLTGSKWADRDEISVQPVMGLVASFGEGQESPPTHMPIPSLLLRQNSMLFGRPVYESENGGQYMYWLEEVEKDGREEAMGEETTQRLCKKMEEGMKPASLISPAQVTTEDAGIKKGYWVISKQVGLQPPHPLKSGETRNSTTPIEGDDVLAYVNSYSYTPVGIDSEKDKDKNNVVWMVRRQDGSNNFGPSKNLKFKPHVGNTNSLDLLDGGHDLPAGSGKQDTGNS